LEFAVRPLQSAEAAIPDCRLHHRWRVRAGPGDRDLTL